MWGFFDRELTSKDYREMADEICRPQINKLAFIYFMYSVVSGFASYFIGGIASFAVDIPFSFSFINIAKKTFLGIKVKEDDLSFGYKNYVRALLINLLSGLYVFLWFLIPIVGPFIAIGKSFSYFLAPYIAIDNPEMGYDECITRSKEYMEGHRMELFYLSISYIGWFILSIFTFGILLFWIQPKMQQAHFLFYLKVSGIGACYVDEMNESYDKDDEIIDIDEISETEDIDDTPCKF